MMLTNGDNFGTMRLPTPKGVIMFKTIESVNSANATLNIVQKSFFINVAEPIIKANDSSSYRYSCVFHTGISPSAIGKKIILVVGQESRDSGDYFCGSWNDIQKYSQWVIDFSGSQVGYNNKYKKLYSPFWNLFRMFDSEKFYLVWTNLDKVHSYRNGKSKPLKTSDEEKRFHESFDDSGKSILQYEIEIIQPDLVVFLTGNNYRISMEKALRLNDGDLEDKEPRYPEYNAEDYNQLNSPETILQDISNKINIIVGNRKIPVYWTFHPNSLQHHHAKKANGWFGIINKICKEK